MPEFVKIDDLLLRCGYSPAAVKQLCASSLRWCGSSLVRRAEAIGHLESLIKSKTCRRLVRLKAAKVLEEELRERQTDDVFPERRPADQCGDNRQL